MFDVRKSLSAVCCAILLASGVSTLRAEDKRIAVVNVSNVFGQYAKVKDIQEKLVKDFKDRTDALEAKGRALKVEVDKLSMDDREQDNAELFRAKLALEQRKFDFQTENKKLYVDVEERRKNEMKDVLKEIKVAIGFIGKREKYDLVMRAPEFADEFDDKAANTNKDVAADKAVSAADLVRKFRENPVLYFASGVDITDKVIDILNADYKARPNK